MRLNGTWNALLLSGRTLTPKEKTAARRLAKHRRKVAARCIRDAELLESACSPGWPFKKKEAHDS